MIADTKSQGELIKIAAELAKSAGPTDEHRQLFGRTFLGSLLGQAVVLLGLMATYLVGLAIIWRYFFDDLRSLQTAVGVWAFWIIVAAPFACILLFSMLPTALRALRERRMKFNVISGDVSPDAFRLYPYGESDRSDFKRLDGADKTILGWLSASKSSVLYLSGPSGVGKSSLLSASVLPALRDKGWKIVETRLFGDPIGTLRTALITAEPRLKKDASSEASLRDLVETAVGHRGKREASPFVLVIDQFEEFLILNKDENRAPFSAFLIDLVRRPIEGLKLILVFRSDYRALVFKLDLPHLIAGENWNELSAYDRGEATAFLRTRGRELVSEAADRLFRGLDRIEDAPGMYRLITLNMVGLVLERMGTKLEGDPGRLIQSYLTTCLKTGEARDYAQHLLQFMITDSGTKEPRKEIDLVTLTQLEDWKVRATLAELARQGLVRRIGDVWEVAHDFLARVIGQLIGRLRPTLLLRFRPLIAPVVLIGWIAFATLAWPYISSVRERTAGQALRELGATFSAYKSNGLTIELDSSKLGEAAAYLENVNPEALHISIRRPTELSLVPIRRLSNLRKLQINDSLPSGQQLSQLDLEPLNALTNLGELSIGNAKNLTALKGLIKLSELRLGGLKETADLEPLRNLTGLVDLTLSDLRNVTSLEPLANLTGLRKLSLSGLDGVKNLEPFTKLTNLRNLTLHGLEKVSDLEPLSKLTGLKAVTLGDLSRITSLEPLGKLIGLEVLELQGMREVTKLDPLANLINVTELSLILMNKVDEIRPIEKLANLRKLSLLGGARITSLEGLKSASKLESLDLYLLPNISSVEPLGELAQLRDISLINVGGLGNLEPLLKLQHLSRIALDADVVDSPALQTMRQRGVMVLNYPFNR